MKNITLSLPDEVYRAARVKAAMLDTSVTALVKDYLERLTSQEGDFKKRLALQRKVIASVKGFRVSDNLSRDEVHNRNAIR